MTVKIKRVYDSPSNSDGQRILVDKLWPRGLTKDKVQVDVWLKDIAPSTELRKWFGHDPNKWAEFQKRFTAELDQNKSTVSQLRELIKQPSTLIYGAKDQEHNNAVVIKNYLNNL